MYLFIYNSMNWPYEYNTSMNSCEKDFCGEENENAF